MEPSLLHKDVGQLPLHLARETGWHSDLVYWMDRPFEIDRPEGYDATVRRVAVSVSPSRARHTLGFLDYVRRHARQTDVVLTYHLTSESLLNLSLYKALNPRGIAVLKLDMDHRGLVGFEERPRLTKRAALMRLFRHTPIDLLLIESESMFQKLKPHTDALGHDLRLLPNGFDGPGTAADESLLADKEDIVLTVGRLGTEQKNTEQLLAAVERLPGEALGNWQFWFVGSRTPTFDARLDALRARRPDLDRRFVVRDFVSSRDELARLYRRARVFCLTSRWESFGLVLVEAARFGCYIISTDVGAAPELCGHGVHGQLVPVGDTGRLTAALERVLTRRVDTNDSARWVHENAVRNYSWPHLARRFAEWIERLGDARSR
jgi:glycosyltransferase involved in cell wall biosynthesis